MCQQEAFTDKVRTRQVVMWVFRLLEESMQILEHQDVLLFVSEVESPMVILFEARFPRYGRILPS